jgi:uroporphyrinogen decarboxylase
LQPVQRFGLDAAILFSDILILPWALGQSLRYVEGEGPLLPPIRTAREIDALDPGRLNGAVEPVLETVRRVRNRLGGDAALIGFAGSPWTVACYMVEGGGSREFAAIRGMAYRTPELLGQLIALLTDATIAYLAAQAEAGAEALMLFDSWAGVLPPSQFKRYVIAPTQAIVTALEQRFPTLPVIGFPRLAGTLLGVYAVETAVDAIGIDTSVWPVVASDLVPEGVAIQGNLDPHALLSGGPELRTHALGIMDALHRRPHIFNLGHGVLPDTPPDHVAELVRIVRNG